MPFGRGHVNHNGMYTRMPCDLANSLTLSESANVTMKTTGNFCDMTW